MVSILFFFFQAEDGIRDVAVTGVQTCALPIFLQGGFPFGPKDRVTVSIHRLREPASLEDVGEKMQVGPARLCWFKECLGHLAGGIIDGPDQAQIGPSALQPVMATPVHLKHHPLSGSSLSATAVFGGTPLTRRSYPF